MVIVVWGANWPVMKYGLTYISPFWFAASRVYLGAATLFLVLLFLRRRIPIPGRQDLPVVVSVGLLQMFGYMGLVHLSLQFVEAGRAAILSYTTPLWVTPAAILFLGERLTGLRAAGLLAGLTGIVVLFNPSALDWSDGDVVAGNLLLLVAALCWAVGILHIRTHTWELTPLDIAPWQMLVAAGPVTLVAALAEPVSAIQWTGGLVAVVAYNGPIATALGFWALISLNRALPAISTSLAILGVPACGFLSSVIFLGEEPDISLVAGLVLILTGVGLVALADWRRAGRPQPART
jgi:drug/metabolite transporter (DMT)-like permease